MKLQTLTRGQVQLVREWRNAELQVLRTPYLITEKMQDEFYDNVINDRDSKHRYFAIIEEYIITPEEDVHPRLSMMYNPESVDNRFIGMVGLTNIEWENGCAEISLIIDPEYRGKGNGDKAVDLILHEAFDQMRLYSVYGEVYDCGNRGFWEKIVKDRKGYMTNLKDRKMYNGKIYDSMWFSVKE